MKNAERDLHDDDLTVLAEFHYAGLAMPVVTTLPQPGVERRWKKLPGEPDGPGGDPYTGYDQFGRTVQMRWFKVSGSPETYDPLVSVAWGYNRASLKLWRQDLLAPTLAAQDQLFSYDGLYQVSERERGVLDTGHTGITGTPAQAEEFGYDETGNWVTYQQNNAGVLDIDQTRENNVSNQITEIGSSSAGVSYDLNGNMLLVPTGESLEGPSRQLVWDAWNRLRIVKDDEDNVLGEYQYDGRTRRTTSAATGVVRHFYYNDQWRSVEERLDAASTAESQYVWHPTDRWELLLRDRSTANNGTLDERLYSMKDQLDPVAVCDDDGAVVERYAYSAFGLTSVLDADFEPQVASTVAWSFLFHGEFRDWETAWYDYGFRYYAPTMGRWLNRDPIGERGGINLYLFASNTPLNHWDKYGLRDCSAESQAAYRACMKKICDWEDRDNSDNWNRNARRRFCEIAAQAVYLACLGEEVAEKSASYCTEHPFICTGLGVLALLALIEPTPAGEFAVLTLVVGLLGLNIDTNPPIYTDELAGDPGDPDCTCSITA